MNAKDCSCCGNPKSGWVALQCHPDIVICHDCLDWLNAKREEALAARGGVRVVSVEPMFRVADVERAVEHYQRLGFATEYHDETYAFALRNNLTIHLARIDTPDQRTTATIFLHVDDVDELADAWLKAGMTIDGPADQDYGLREASHVDPDGNLIRFGSPVPN